MGIKDSLKKILPLSAASTRSEFSKTKTHTDKIGKKLDKYGTKVVNLENATARRLQSLEDAMSATDRRLNTVEFQVGKCRQSSEYNGTRIEHLGKAISGTATKANLNEIQSKLWANGKATIAATSASMGRFMLEHLDYHIVDHCNLNCACCSTYSPLAAKRFASIEEFERDLTRLHEIIGDKLLRLHLLGGEPLLHPEIIAFMETARTTFPDARIDVTTNGVLVAEMGNSFWEAMRDNRIDLKYTQYPLKNVDYEGIIESAKEKGVFAFSAGDGEIEYFRRIPLNAKGTSNVHSTYIQCPYIDCPQIREGRLYRCPASAFSDILNKALCEENQLASFHLSALDYLDLYSDITEEDIFEFLSRPIPFCQYCDMGKVDNRIKWSGSTRSITEWVDL